MSDLWSILFEMVFSPTNSEYHNFLWMHEYFQILKSTTIGRLNTLPAFSQRQLFLLWAKSLGSCLTELRETHSKDLQDATQAILDTMLELAQNDSEFHSTLLEVVGPQLQSLLTDEAWLTDGLKVCYPAPNTRKMADDDNLEKCEKTA
jgi:hypothetical protein